MMTGLKVPFGTREGRLVPPTDELPVGLACLCTCPGCGAALILRQGGRRRHFAHHNAPGAVGCVESAIHAAAKQVLVEHGGMYVPEVSFGVSATTLAGEELFESDVLSARRFIRFDRTRAEVTIGDVRPDVVGYRGERQLLVEMFFRHRVDDIKRDKLKTLDLAAIEIDLADLDPGDGFDAIRQRVVDDVLFKEWLVYPRRDEHIAYMRHQLQVRVEAANEAHKVELQRRAAERARQSELDRAGHLARATLDSAFASWAPAEQEHWLCGRLGLSDAIPAFLTRQTYPRISRSLSPFLFQGTIFERFIHGEKPGTRISSPAIYPCLKRRFDLLGQEKWQDRSAIDLYLDYLASARFLHRTEGSGLSVSYLIEHSEVSMPAWAPADLHFDGWPLLSHRARGDGPVRQWHSIWPRRALGADAVPLLTQAPHDALVLEHLQALSALHRPPTPHHWAEPLVAQGMSLSECMGILDALGLLASPRG